MIFQEPMTSLNPCFTVGWQIGEALQRASRSVACRGAARARSNCCARWASPRRNSACRRFRICCRAA